MRPMAIAIKGLIVLNSGIPLIYDQIASVSHCSLSTLLLVYYINCRSVSNDTSEDFLLYCN